MDDTKGYGPEKISQPLVKLAAGNLAKLGAHYYGPRNGKPAKTRIEIYRGENKILTIGPCTLKPADWWQAGSINLNSGNIFPDTSCSIKSMPNLSRRHK